jgi:squalene synthase HpnC
VSDSTRSDRPSDAAPPIDRIQRKLQSENFPVALRLLPAQLRADLTTVYGVVRVIDDLGDEAAGDRVALLEAFAADLARVWTTGAPDAPVLRDLVPTVVRRRMSPGPFDRLIQANLMDQRVAAYATWDDLIGYCHLSAAPIGQMVLEIFDAVTPERLQLSDRVCNALQLLEHWQDVAEDRRLGRIYLPNDDRVRFGVADTDLDASTSTPALRRLIAFETERANDLLGSGWAITDELHGWARVAVSGYVAGGRATVDALRRPGVDVLAASPKPRKSDIARYLARHLRGGRS